MSVKFPGKPDVPKPVSITQQDCDVVISWTEPYDGAGDGKAPISSYRVELKTDGAFVDTAALDFNCGSDPAYLKCTIPMTKL